MVMRGQSINVTLSPSPLNSHDTTNLAFVKRGIVHQIHDGMLSKLLHLTITYEIWTHHFTITEAEERLLVGLHRRP